MQTGSHRSRLGVLAFVAAAVAIPPAFAQETGDTPNQGALSFSGGVDITTLYLFRGIPQENEDLIFQPYFGVGIPMWENEEQGISFGADLGVWNSVHTNGDTKGWYEADASAGVSVGLPQGFEASLKYVLLNAPKAGGIFAEEINIGVAWDESQAVEDLGFTLSPSLLFVQEIDGGSDAGGNEGTYLELGVNPSMEVAAGENLDVTISLPVKLGIGLSDYYEDQFGNDDSFGFVDFGLVGSIPLNQWISSSYGSWSLSGSIHFAYVGDAAGNIGRVFGVTSGSKQFFVYTTWGLAFEY